jgi:hypothetical protein
MRRGLFYHINFLYYRNVTVTVVLTAGIFAILQVVVAFATHPPEKLAGLVAINVTELPTV